MHNFICLDFRNYRLFLYEQEQVFNAICINIHNYIKIFVMKLYNI